MGTTKRNASTGVFVTSSKAGGSAVKGGHAASVLCQVPKGKPSKRSQEAVTENASRYGDALHRLANR